MSQSLDLLRLLEPAVRPVTAASPTPAPGGETPFEQQDFDRLLADARRTNPETPPTSAAPATATAETAPSVAERANPLPEASADAASPPSADPLNLLADFSRIENPGLRQLLAEARPDSASISDAA